MSQEQLSPTVTTNNETLPITNERLQQLSNQINNITQKFKDTFNEMQNHWMVTESKAASLTRTENLSVWNNGTNDKDFNVFLAQDINIAENQMRYLAETSKTEEWWLVFKKDWVYITVQVWANQNKWEVMMRKFPKQITWDSEFIWEYHIHPNSDIINANIRNAFSWMKKEMQWDELLSSAYEYYLQQLSSPPSYNDMLSLNWTIIITQIWKYEIHHGKDFRSKFPINNESLVHSELSYASNPNDCVAILKKYWINATFTPFYSDKELYSKFLERFNQEG